jgi:hypothetical protein
MIVGRLDVLRGFRRALVQLVLHAKRISILNFGHQARQGNPQAGRCARLDWPDDQDLDLSTAITKAHPGFFSNSRSTRAVTHRFPTCGEAPPKGVKGCWNERCENLTAPFSLLRRQLPHKRGSEA